MVSTISDETIEYVGVLAKLELSPEKKEEAKEDVRRMLDYIDKLNELDIQDVEPMSYVSPVRNVFRKDVVTDTDQEDQILSNTPQRKGGAFKAPKTVR